MQHVLEKNCRKHMVRLTFESVRAYDYIINMRSPASTLKPLDVVHSAVRFITGDL